MVSQSMNNLITNNQTNKEMAESCLQKKQKTPAHLGYVKMADGRSQNGKKKEVANSSSCRTNLTEYALNPFKISFPLGSLANGSQVLMCILFKQQLSECQVSQLPRKAPQQDTGEFVWNIICRGKTSSGSLNKASEASSAPTLTPILSECNGENKGANTLAHDWQFLKQKASKRY